MMGELHFYRSGPRSFGPRTDVHATLMLGNWNFLGNLGPLCPVAYLDNLCKDQYGGQISGILGTEFVGTMILFASLFYY